MTHLSQVELKKVFSKFGKDVFVSQNSKFYNCIISIGNNVRIDDGCIFKGNIEIGNNVHIGAYSIIGGKEGKVVIGNQIGISNNVCIYTATEDFLSKKRGNPTIPDKDRDIILGDVTIEDECIIGTGTKIFPKSLIGSQTSISANCIINGRIPRKSFVLQQITQKVVSL